MDCQTNSHISLTVSRRSVKTIKNALEAHDLLDKSIKISPIGDGQSFSIPLRSISLKDISIVDSLGRNEVRDTYLSQFLSSIGEERCKDDVALSLSELPDRVTTTESSSPNPLSHGPVEKRRNNPVDVTVDAWLKSILNSIPPQPANGELRRPPTISPESALCQNTSGYAVYPPMLLLPPAALSNYLEECEYFDHLPRLYENLSCTFKVTHIALNAPIPVSYLNQNLSASKPDGRPVARPNHLRSPTGLKPLHGDFGPALPPSHTVLSSDYESAFWCTARQNAIFQTWAPRYTMFSNGNISEKARVLHLACSGFRPGPEKSSIGYIAEQSTAIDLYAGIGYFTFSYAKAGVAKILCWEINPWSVEGLRRGARVNRWPTKSLQRHGDDTVISKEAIEEDLKILIFEESNAYATARIHAIRHLIPPIRHVNCGFLPSSKESWRTAVAALDPWDGGWIHAHENIAKKDIETREHEVVGIFQDLVAEVYGQSKSEQRLVYCEHFERVKSYAPGVIHCVLDIAIIPVPSGR